MKNVLLLAFSLLFTITLSAQKRQVSSPRLSPLHEVKTKIGLLDVELTYSRPSMRERTIFGDLVPFDKVWRTGANKNTKITFSDPINIDGKLLEAGTYTLFTKPNKDKWDVYFHTYLDEYGAPEVLEEKNIVAQISVPAQQSSRTLETLFIGFENLTAKSASIVIAWENTYVSIPTEVPTGAVMEARMAAATKTMASDYSATGWNYHNIEKNSNAGVKYVDMAITLQENGQTFEEWMTTIDPENWSAPWNYTIKAEMHAALGELKEAKAAAKRALMIAEKINSKYYTKRNTENMEKWAKK